MRWGLVPVWAKDPKSVPLMINAKAETVAEKPSFSRLVTRQRCGIPADGFFEWMKLPVPEGAKKGAKPEKQPFHFRLKENDLYSSAGQIVAAEREFVCRNWLSNHASWLTWTRTALRPTA